MGTAAFDTNQPLCNQANRLWIQFPFELLNPCGKSLCGILIEHRQTSLQDDWAMVIFEIGEMDSDSGHFHPRIDDCLMDMVTIHPLATESRNESWMNIDDSATVGIRERIQRHETRQDNQVDWMMVEVQVDRLAEFLGGSELLAREDQTGNVCLAGFFDSAYPRSAR